MTIGLLGIKCGMTRLLTDTGSIPVTVIEVQPNRITQIKTLETDGYHALQVTSGKIKRARKRTRLTKPLTGHYAKAGVEPGSRLHEFRIEDPTLIAGFTVGAELTVDRFAVGQFIDVTGISKGKGYAGTIKRHNFSSQDATHGNSVSHRAPGSIGQRQSPGKVFKNKRMSGHLGDVQCTVLSQKIAYIDVERHLILVHGAVPGAISKYVIIRPAVKKSA